MACRDKNELPTGITWRRIYEIEGGEWKSNGKAYTGKPFGYFLSISCNNCEDAPCINACPTSAMHLSDDGLVMIDRMLCLGCDYCKWTCPYDALHLDPSGGIMGKCDFCIDLLYEGRNPACVDACPMRAIEFGYCDDFEGREGLLRSVFPLPDEKMTKPSLYIRAHKDAKGSDKSNAGINNTGKF